MSNVLIGKKFESKAYSFLKTKFDKVEWLSKEDNQAPYDFLCWRGLKRFYGDAKFNSRQNKPILRPTQIDADFVICNNVKNNNFRIIYRKNFKNKVKIVDNKFIQIPADIYEDLSNLREKHEPYSSVIKKLIAANAQLEKNRKYAMMLEKLPPKSHITL